MATSKTGDNGIIIYYQLLQNPSSADEVARFVVTSWPMELPPAAPTTTTTTTTTTRTTTTTTKTTTTTTTTTTQKPTTTTTKTSTTTTTPIPTRPPTVGPVGGQCGRVAGSRIGRVMGGVETDINEQPWLVQLRYRYSGRIFQYRCVGTLIDPNHIMTALHCFFPGKANTADWRVVIGATGSDTPVYEEGVREERIAQIIWEENELGEDRYLGGYNPISDGHDIAILKLWRPITDLPVMCLPSPNLVDSQINNCIIAGWGGRNDGTRRFSDTLQSAEVSTVQRNVCNNNGHYRGQVRDEYICAGREGVDTCKGDGGAPLICRNPYTGAYEAAGIAAWGGTPCGRK